VIAKLLQHEKTLWSRYNRVCAYIGQSGKPILQIHAGGIVKYSQLASEILFNFAQNGRLIEHQKESRETRGGRFSPYLNVRIGSMAYSPQKQNRRPGIRCSAFCACRHLQQAGRRRVASSGRTIM